MPKMIAAIFLFLFLTTASAASATPPVDASGLYQQAFQWWSQATSGEEPLLTPAERNAITDPIDGAPTPLQRSAHAKMQPYFEHLREAAALEACTWGVDRSAGFDALLPQLAQLRSAARAFRFDAQMCLSAGDTAGAITSLGALSNFSDHAQREGMLVSSLVAAAIGSLQSGEIDRLIGSSLLEPEEAERLLESLARYERNDPFALRESLANERAAARVSLERMLTDSEIDEALLDPESDFTELSLEERRAELDRYDAAYAAFDRALALKDRDAIRAEVALVVARLEAGEFGDLSRMFLPAVDHALEAAWRISDALAERRTTLIGIRDGTLDPATLWNAAFAYQRLAALAAALPEEAQARIEAARVAASALDEVTREETRALLAPLRARVRSNFEQARRSERCNFDAVMQAGAAYLPHHLPGLRGAIRLLFADAILGEPPAPPDAPAVDRRTPAASPEEAAASALILCRHLGADGRLGSSLVALSVLEETAEAIDLFLREGRLDDDARERLAALLSALPREDLLGFRGAATKERERILPRMAVWSFETDLRTATDTFLTRRGPGVLAGWLLGFQIGDAEWLRRNVPGFGSDLHASLWDDRASPWSEAALALPLVGAGDLVEAASLPDRLAAHERWVERVHAFMNDEAPAPTPEAWTRMLSAQNVEPPIDVTLRSLAAGPILSRIDDLLTRGVADTAPPSAP